MPENLRRAREMANLNRNKLRIMTNAERGMNMNLYSRDQNLPVARAEGPQGNHEDQRYGSHQPNINYHSDMQKVGVKTLDHQFSDGKQIYQKLRQLNYKNAPLSYEFPQPTHDLPSLAQRHTQMPDKQSLNDQPGRPDQSEKRFQSMSYPNLGRQARAANQKDKMVTFQSREDQQREQREFESQKLREQERQREIQIREQYLRELDEQIRREKELLSAIEQQEHQQANKRMDDERTNPQNQQQSSTLQPHLNQNGYPNQMTAEHSPFNQEANSNAPLPDKVPQDYYSGTGAYYDRYSGNAQVMNQSQEHQNRQYSLEKNAPKSQNGMPSTSPVTENHQAPIRDIDWNGGPSPKDMFRNTDEFNNFNKLSEADKKVYMAAFLRGQKGREFSLDTNGSDRLKKLNDFYEDYLKEQYKRRVPMLPDDYRYRSMVNHLKRNNIL